MSIDSQMVLVHSSFEDSSEVSKSLAVVPRTGAGKHRHYISTDRDWRDKGVLDEVVRVYGRQVSGFGQVGIQV